MPTIGAIRWDAWYAPDWPTDQRAAAALTPREYHFRLPFFAKVKPDGGVVIDGGSQAILDQEIDQASHAGIDYWAFLAYPPNSGMSVALHLYLASPKKASIRFCMFTDLASFGGQGRLAPMVLEHVRLMGDPQYMRVMENRPLYYMGFFSDSIINEHWGGAAGLRQAIEDFRDRARKAGFGNPYIVLGGAPSGVARWVRQLGLDAVGAYAITAAGSHSYTDLTTLAERRWNEEAATGLPVVPTVMTGWDLRPRLHELTPAQRVQQLGATMTDHYETARPAEIAAHLRNALNWTWSHTKVTEANTVLVYAWDENDEGGWLVPTFPFDDSRLQAVRAVLCSWRTQHHLASAC